MICICTSDMYASFVFDVVHDPLHLNLHTFKKDLSLIKKGFCLSFS